MSKSSSASVFAGSCLADKDRRSAFALRICSRNAADDFEALGAGLLDPIWGLTGWALVGVVDGPTVLVDSVKSSAMLGLFTPILPETVLLPLSGSLGVRFVLSVCGGTLSTDLIMDAFVEDCVRGTVAVVGRLVVVLAVVGRLVVVLTVVGRLVAVLAAVVGRLVAVLAVVGRFVEERRVEASFEGLEGRIVVP